MELLIIAKPPEFFIKAYWRVRPLLLQAKHN